MYLVLSGYQILLYNETLAQFYFTNLPHDNWENY